MRRPCPIFLSSKGSRSVFVGHMFCWRPGVPRPNKHTFLKNRCFLALPPRAARPTQNYVLEHVCFLALVCQASKQPLGQKGGFVVLCLRFWRQGPSLFGGLGYYGQQTLCQLCGRRDRFEACPGRGWFLGGCGRTPDANGPASGPKLPEPSAQAIWDRILVRSH